MIKLKKCTIVLVILIFVYQLMFSNTYASCNTMTLRKDVSAVKVTLSDGSVLYDIQVEKRQETAPANAVKDTNIIFLVDTDMMNLDGIKNDLRAFPTQLSGYTSNIITLSKLHLAYIGIDNNKEDLTDDEIADNEDVFGKFSAIGDLTNDDHKFNANDAVEIATTKLQENYNPLNGIDNNDVTQMIVIITDGFIGGKDIKSETQIRLRQAADNTMALIYGIAINLGTTDKANDLLDVQLTSSVLAGAPVVNKLASDGTDVLNILVNVVKADVESRMINYFYVIPTGNVDGAAVLPGEIQIYMDSEIMQGALLEIEYEISGSASVWNSSTGTMTQTNFNVWDLIPNNMQYDENHYLLTENSTNKNEGWRFDAGYSRGNLDAYNSKIALHNSSGGGDPSKKIVLSTILSKDSYDQDGYINHINGNNGIVSPVTPSMVVKIVPPFGNEKHSELTRNIIIGGTLGIASITIIAIIIKRKKFAK